MSGENELREEAQRNSWLRDLFAMKRAGVDMAPRAMPRLITRAERDRRNACRRAANVSRRINRGKQ